ncbi:MAG: citrate (Si)-synthase [Bacteroidales bacterium]|nr:citrate (Si)-synthase [Bacteroidales bacterium]
MITLKEKLAEKIEQHRPRIKQLLSSKGDTVIDTVSVNQVLGGMRGIKSLLTDISYLDPNEGIRYRGYTLKEVFDKLPKPEGGQMPSVESLYYLLLTGEIPTQEESEEVTDEFRKRRNVPSYVYEVIDAFPDSSHPMAIFSAAIITMARESLFNKKYHKGISKSLYWESTYEDAIDLLAKLPDVGAYIYTKLYKNRKHIHSNPDLDLGANFAHMMGIDKPYDDVARMHFIIHADHESGNVSAHTGHLVASSLSDIYLCVSAMINALAGPLHGLANQEVLRWIQDLRLELGDNTLSEDKLKQFVWDTLNSGQVVPGFGHAVLRKTDPRYMIQREFSLNHLPEDALFRYVDKLYEIVPPILKEHGKAKNPWPNVDAQSGVIQWHYGVQEYEFYTVLFGIGRALGVTANIIWDRALMFPIERPKSITTRMLEELAT